MEKRKFSSPREEALEIARKTRKDILNGKGDAVSVLRASLVIANILNKDDKKQWISRELSGYLMRDELPFYRNISCEYERSGLVQRDFRSAKIPYPAHMLRSFFRRNKTMRISRQGEILLVTVELLERILSEIVDSCLFFLNDIIAELQYGGAVEYLMEEIRKNTDEKLAKLDKKLADESQSLFLNLTSTNPADWNKVGHSCRKMLKLLADNVFAPGAEPYQMKDGRIFEVGDPQFINRLCAFFDQKVAGEERKFLCAEIEYLESYLRQVVEYAQMGEHKPSIEKYHADMIAIHTYLIISEVLKHKD
ncbi:MAG: hypothetical protein ACFE7E_08715 [Candidatus Hodarchaeota archaeon]